MASVDFNEIRKAVSVVDVLPWLNIELHAENSQLRGPCPVRGGERSFVVTPGENVWACHQPTCKEHKLTKGGGVIELVMKVKQITSVRDAAIEIQKQFNVGSTAPPGLHSIAEKLIHEHDEVQSLGISIDDAQRLGIGYIAGGVAKGRVLLPIRTTTGTLVGYYQWSDRLEPKLKVPSKLF